MVYIGIFWAAVALYGAGYLLYRRYILKQARQTDKIRFRTETGKKNRLYIFYRLFQMLPFTKKEFEKVHARVRILYPSDEMSINREVTRIMTGSAGMFLAVVAVSVLASGGDLFYLALGLFVGTIFFKNSAEHKLERANLALLTQFSEFVSGLIPAYREERGHLDDAVYRMLNELPQLVSLHLSNVYEILSSPRAEQKAEQYTEYAPNRYILSFVSLAVPVKVYGDKVLPDGNTAFVKGLMNLKKEMNEELLKQSALDNAFSMLSTISIAGVFLLKPVEWYFTKFMPETAAFFNGPLGLAVMLTVFFVSYGCYQLIVSLKAGKQSTIKEITIWSRIASLRRVNEILNIQMNRHFTEWMRIDKKLKSAGDHTGVKAFKVRSAVFAAIAFLLSNAFFIVADINAADNAIHYTAGEFQNVMVPDVAYTGEMERVAEKLNMAHKHDRNIRVEELATEIRSMSEYLKADDLVLPVAEAVVAHVKKYQNTYFKWWYEVVAVLCAAGAYCIPFLFLSYQSRQVQMEKEDEVNSFNLLALIFMDMDGIQTQTILEWMERFSNSYRNAIGTCIVNLEMGEKKALQELYEYDNMFEFRKFVRALMSVDDIGFKQAFADLEIQQDYYNEKRKQDNQKLIRQKSGQASRIAFIPMYTIIILDVIAPMLYYAYSLASRMAGVFAM